MVKKVENDGTMTDELFSNTLSQFAKIDVELPAPFADFAHVSSYAGASSEESAVGITNIGHFQRYCRYPVIRKSIDCSMNCSQFIGISDTD